MGRGGREGREVVLLVLRVAVGVGGSLMVRVVLGRRVVGRTREEEVRGLRVEGRFVVERVGRSVMRVRVRVRVLVRVRERVCVEDVAEDGRLLVFPAAVLELVTTEEEGFCVCEGGTWLLVLDMLDRREDD